MTFTTGSRALAISKYGIAAAKGSVPTAPSDTSTTPAPRWRGRILQLFPATTFLLAPYLGLILPIALIQGNRQLPFILGLLGLALLGCLVAEGLTAPVRARIDLTRTAGPTTKALRAITIGVTMIAAATRIAFVLAGGGSLLAQLTGSQQSPIASAASLFSSWNLFGVGLIFACYMRKACSKRTLWLGISAIILIEGWAALQTSVTAPLLQVVTSVMLMALVLGLVRLRVLVVALIVVLLAWPTFFSLRNSVRVELGSSVDQSVTAFDRLRFDDQLTAVAQFKVPVSVNQPGPLQVLRYGLVPRVLDPNRPNISSAGLINRVLGGSSTSSYNFLSIGTIYFFYGPAGLIFYYFAAALLFSYIVSRAIRAGPIALCMAVLAASSLMGWASTFPDVVIGYLQALISFVPILVVLLIFKQRDRSHPGAAGSAASSSTTR
ncbi:hypothetical protein [Diaminobutyricibacter sp. McL0608]|uniref:hypothetical protein n=1 Tax=Leifsonia sp. McL0608 TaxID=3143537 RepID=UPI0031F31285